METSTNGSRLCFTEGHTRFDTAFLKEFADRKLDEYGLSEDPREIFAYYEAEPAGAAGWGANSINIPHAALDLESIPIRLADDERYLSASTLYNFNTYESFKNRIKSATVLNAGNKIYGAIISKDVYKNPSILASSLICSFLDLKKYKFHYHTFFPGATSDWVHDKKPHMLSKDDAKGLIPTVNSHNTNVNQRGFFLAKKIVSGSSVRWKIADIDQFENNFFDGVPVMYRFICFGDSSIDSALPNWVARNFLFLARTLWGLTEVRLIAYRDTQYTIEEPRSTVFYLSTPSLTVQPSCPKFFGWEKIVSSNPPSKAVTGVPVPPPSPPVARSTCIDLSSQLDKMDLAKEAVRLNLRLIKWQIAPSLNLESIAGTKCLLLGAGTLGSYVARGLLAWGVHKITFVDNGMVSFSNPVRQPLYTYEDSTQPTEKAVQAAKALSQIFPGVDAQGKVLSIPMLGHSIDPNDEKAKQDFLTLCELFLQHDVIFLLTDTRESRWLPTVMGKALGKTVLSVGIGFDSYTIVRNGLFRSQNQAAVTAKILEGIEFEEEAPCYFCSDMIAASNSTRDATLDQQCTVTRAGAAPIASGVAVEMFASILQHPLRGRAPPPVFVASNGDIIGQRPKNKFDNPLGVIPHRVLGDMKTFTSTVMTGAIHKECPACSKPIVNAFLDGPGGHGAGYQENITTLDPELNWAFVIKSVNQTGWVEEISGLKASQDKAAAVALDWTGDDEDDDGYGVIVVEEDGEEGVYRRGNGGNSDRSVFELPAWLRSSSGQSHAAHRRRHWLRQALVLMVVILLVSIFWNVLWYQSKLASRLPDDGSDIRRTG